MFFYLNPVYATNKVNDSASLNGIKEVEVVYMINLPNPQSTLGYLQGIDATRKLYIEQGVTPRFVLVFEGQTVRYISQKPNEELLFEYPNELQGIADTVAKFKDLGVRMEICSVALDYFKLEHGSVLPGMTVVGDSSISMIGWQYQGYKAIY